MIVDRLPLAWAQYPDFVRFARRGYYFQDKSHTHQRLGPAWALVTPVAIYVHFSDPITAIHEIFTRRGDFVRTVKEYKALEVFGPCTSTAGWEEWPRHRKVIASPFNESIMKFVWHESLRQANAMVESWVNTPGFSSVQEDTRTLSLNVLASTGLRSHMIKMLDDEMKAFKDGRPESGGLMTSLAHAVDLHNREAISPGTPQKGLPVDEVLGNLFVLNFAGHDTTASTLSFMMMLLAGNPNVQDWLCDEITACTGDQDVAEWEYKTVYLQLKRCRAVLYETLRVFPPIMALPKWTPDKAQTIEVEGNTFLIPPGVGTIPYLLAVHTDPKYWYDPFTWRPSRWIQTGHTEASASASPFSAEELFVPEKNRFFPWSDGPLNCPGKKFSEVEAVAVLASLCKSNRLLARRLPGESPEDAAKRAAECAADCSVEMLLHMTNSRRVPLVCETL